MKPNFEDILAFLTVVDTRSFTAASDALGRTKSALSQAISRLESELGLQLLFRTTRSLKLTEAGGRLYAHGLEMKKTYDSALADLGKQTKQISGKLSVTGPHALCSTLIASAVAVYLKEFPEMTVRLVADDAKTDLVDSRIDLAIRVGQPMEQKLKIAKLGMLKESLYACSSYVELKGGRPKDLAALSNWTHIANEWQGHPVTYTDVDGNILRVSPKVQCNALPEILHLIQKSAGVARLPDIITNAQSQQTNWIQLFSLKPTPIYYAHLFHETVPLKVRKFIQILRQGLTE